MAILKKIWKDGQFYRAIVDLGQREIEMREIPKSYDISIMKHYEDKIILDGER